jgi:hypothetical protein
VVLAALLLAPERPAAAQTPNCPNGSTPLQLPFGMYPGSSAVCGTASNQSTVNDPWIPCGSGVMTEPGIAIGFSPLLFMPPLSYTYPSGKAGLAFALSIDYGIAWPAHAWPEVKVSSYTSGGMLLDTMTFDRHFRRDQVSPDKYIYYFVQAADLGCLVPGCNAYLNMTQGAYLVFDLVNYTVTGVDRYYFSSVRVVDSGWTPPEMCNGIPYPAPPQPTPTPQDTPTNTPTPTATPTGEWPTPTPSNTPIMITLTPNTPGPTPSHWPTSPPITPSPQATPTQAALATIPVILPTSLPSPMFAPIELPAVSFPAPNMPAPTPINVQAPNWAVPVFGDLQFTVPTYSAPITPTFGYTATWPVIGTPGPLVTATTPLTLAVGLTPNPTIDALSVVISGTLGDVQIAATRWYTVTTGGGDFLIGGDTGAGSTIATIGTFVSNLSLPIRYLKSLQDWFPNIWVFILFLLIAFAWINFVILAKFLVHNGTKILEVIRRLIELIPGF